MTDVLLAVYAGEAYLEEQLASLRRQSFEDFRVLMQDDGSPDASPRILREACADPRFCLGTENGRHLGASGNFLSLIRQSGAKWIALCDQDDVWREDRLARCHQAMLEAEARWGEDTPILVHSDAEVTDADGTTRYPSFLRHQGWNPRAVSLPELLVQNNVTGCTVYFNAALRELAARGAETAVPMHDWFLAQCAAAAGRIVYVPAPLVRYRQHGGNAIGAGQTLPRRLLRGLDPARGRARIEATWTQAEALLAAVGPLLPEKSAETVRRYLALRGQPKWKRLVGLRRGGYRMQSPLARAGHLVYG